MADLQHLIKYHEEKLKDALNSKNKAAINHHQQALHFLKRQQPRRGGEEKND